MMLKIQELKNEILELNEQSIKDTKQIEQLNFEINQSKSIKNEVNYSINDFTRRHVNLHFELKNIHESYHKLPERTMQEHINCKVFKRKEELLQEKRNIESQLGNIKCIREEKLKGLNSQTMIQQVCIIYKNDII